MKYLKVVLAAVFLCVLLIGGTLAILLSSKTVTYTGTIAAVNVEVYNDAGLLTPCVSLNVGSVWPGTTANQTVYIKNSGTVPETLTLAVSNWNPTYAGELLTLTWDRQNYVLPSGNASVKAVITLTAPANTGNITTFSCDVTITGTG